MLDLSLFRNRDLRRRERRRCCSSRSRCSASSSSSRSTSRTSSATRRSQAGATFLPMTLLIILVAPIAGKLSDRIGSRWLIGGGMTLLAGSLVYLLAARRGLDLLGPLPGDAARRRRHGADDDADDRGRDGSVPVDKAGVGSAVLNSVRQVGGSLGIALMGAIVASTCTSGRRRRSAASSSSTGFQHALLVAAGIAFAGRGRRGRHAAQARARRRGGQAIAGGGSVTATRTAPAGGRAPRGARSTPRAASSPRAATAARRPPRSPARPASPSRSSTGTSRSKRDLYLACLDEAWRASARAVGAALEPRSGPADVGAAIGTTYLEARAATGSCSSTSGSRR